MKQERWMKIASIAALLGAHIAILIGGIIAFKIGRMRYFGLFLYATVGLIGFDALYMSIDRWTLPTGPSAGDSFWLRWMTDVRMIGVLLSGVVTVFLLLGRGLVAYVVVAIAGAALVYRVTYRELEAKEHILLLAGLLAGILLSMRVFTVPYLAETFDTIKHVAIAESIVQRGSISHLQDTRNNGFLVFHVLTAILVQLTTVSARSSAGLLFAIAFPAGLMATYAFISRRAISQRLAMLAAVLLALTPTFLSWGSKAHYQSLSFVFFTFALLIVGGGMNKRRAALIGTPVFIAWVSTHHLSVAMAAILLAIPTLHDVLSLFQNNSQPNYLSIVLFVIIASKWTILTSWFLEPLLWIMLHSPQARSGTGSAEVYIETYRNFAEIASAAFPFFIDYIHLSLLLALSAVGILTLLRVQREYSMILVGAVIGSIFFFPNPLWIPLRGFATLLRWDIVVLPFVIVLPAAGILAFVKGTTTEKSIRHFTSIAFVALILFSMISAGFFSPTTSDFIGADRHDRIYLTVSDINAAEWTKAYASTDRPVYATSKLLGYLMFDTQSVLTERNYDYRRARVTGIHGRVVFLKGLTVFQANAFRTEAVKMALIPDSDYSTDTMVHAPVSGAHVDYNSSSANLVYSNGETVVQESDDNNLN